MPIYHVNTNAQANGDHEVHENGCVREPFLQNRFALGSHAYCGSAVAEAKRHFPRSNGCYHCCSACHTG